MHRYRRILRYALREWPTLLLILALAAVASLVTVLQPWPLKALVDYAAGPTALPQPIAVIFARYHVSYYAIVLIAVAALASLVLFAVNSVLDVVLTRTWTAAGQRMLYGLAADLFHRLQRVSLALHNRRSVGDSLARLTGDSWCVYTVTDALLIAPAHHLLTLATVGVIAWRLDAGLAALSLAIAPALGASAVFFGRRLKQRARLNREAQSRLLSFVHQTFGAIPMVQAYGTETRNREQFRQLADAASAATQRETIWKGSYGFVNGLATAVGTAVIIYIGGQRVLRGTMSVGSLIVFLAYLRSLQAACQGLLGIYGNLKSVEASVDRVLEVLDTQEAVRESPSARPLPAPARGHVRLDNVRFGYEPERPVLNGINLEVSHGEIVALVGPTGAGKTTIASLVLRLYDPWEGRVTFDGVDMREVKLASLRASVAVLLQDPFLLPLTVAQNIAYGRPQAMRTEIEAAARTANADEFIRALPDGYNSVLGERGATLSGGERQRIAIARALLKDAPVLILDEPTSALDAQTESLVMEALRRLMKDRTTIIIAHRLSTVRHANRIVVLDAGRVVETGPHEQLVAAGGLYQRLYEAQFAANRKEALT